MLPFIYLLLNDILDLKQVKNKHSGWCHCWKHGSTGKNISDIALTSLSFSCSELLSLCSVCNSSLCKGCVFKNCSLWFAFLFSSSSKKDSFLLLSAPAAWSSAMCCKALSLCSSCFSSPCNVLWCNRCLFPKWNFSNFSERATKDIRHKADILAVCTQCSRTLCEVMRFKPVS